MLQISITCTMCTDTNFTIQDHSAHIKTKASCLKMAGSCFIAAAKGIAAIACIAVVCLVSSAAGNRHTNGNRFSHEENKRRNKTDIQFVNNVVDLAVGYDSHKEQKQEKDAIDCAVEMVLRQ